MTDLKTLKDVRSKIHAVATGRVGPNSGKPTFLFNGSEQHELVNSEYVKIKTLKQEAIKEIKVLKNLGESKEDLLWERITGKKIVYSKEATEVITRYIKWKFNITEGDLK